MRAVCMCVQLEVIFDFAVFLASKNIRLSAVRTARSEIQLCFNVMHSEVK